MKRVHKIGCACGIIVAIVAAIVIALVVVLATKKEKAGPRVLYFAIHLGDPAEEPAELFRKESCSFRKNVLNTRASIKAMKDLHQKYRFILYTDVVNVTSVMTNDKALGHLDTLQSVSYTSAYSQEKVAKAFVDMKHADDLLIFYIPCDFDYSSEGEDLRTFVELIKNSKIESTILLVSSTNSSEVVAKVYNQSNNNVVGTGEDVARRIYHFAEGNDNESTTRMPAPTTAVPARTTTLSTTSTSENMSTLPYTSTTTAETTRITTTSLPPSPSTVVHTSTVESTTPEPVNILKCLFVADYWNFRKDTEAYDQEHSLIETLGHAFLFEKDTPTKAAIWAYGHTTLGDKPNLDKMTGNWTQYSKDLKNMTFKELSTPLSTASAVYILNQLKDDHNRTNCLVFFSAAKSMTYVPQLEPRYMNLKRIVAVGLNGTNLSPIVSRRGMAINVPFPYAVKDVIYALDVIMGRIVPSTLAPTTRPPTTTTGWKIEELSCLFVCDFYNYGNNSEALYYETELLGIIGYDVFAKVTRSSVGLWAYGYTDFPKAVNSSLETMVENYGQYEKQLREISYVPLPDPLSTQGAIEAINEMEDSEKVLNCLVFLTAQINTKSLPKLNPKNKEMEKIVVVGLNGTSPKNILPENGAMATVPYYFTERDINNVVNLIIGKVYRTTRKSTRSFVTPYKVGYQLNKHI